MRVLLPVICSGTTRLTGVLAWWSPFPPSLIAGFSSARRRVARNGPDEKVSASASECFRGTFSGLGLYPWPCVPRGAGHTVKAMRGEEEWDTATPPAFPPRPRSRRPVVRLAAHRSLRLAEEASGHRRHHRCRVGRAQSTPGAGITVRATRRVRLGRSDDVAFASQRRPRRPVAQGRHSGCLPVTAHVPLWITLRCVEPPR